MPPYVVRLVYVKLLDKIRRTRWQQEAYNEPYKEEDLILKCEKSFLVANGETTQASGEASVL